MCIACAALTTEIRFDGIDFFPRAETDEALAVLSLAMELPGGGVLGRRHPGLCHYHVHLLEMAPTKKMVLEAASSADALRSQWHEAGHLLHMASHIDVHVGRYDAAVRTNQAAVRADERFAELRGTCNYYFTYRLHTLNQLIWCSNFDGQYRVARAAAEAIISDTPAELVAMWVDWIEPLFANIWYVLVRFGLWDEVLGRTLPRAELCVSRATAYWAKAIALGALGRLPEAFAAQAEFTAAAAAVPASRHIHMVPSSRTLEVGAVMLDGELAYRAGEHDRGFERLRQAANLELDLPYDEPWGWMTPTEHALGALLAEQRRFTEADAVFRHDLVRWPNNLWSLRGLKQCLSATRRQHFSYHGNYFSLVTDNTFLIIDVSVPLPVVATTMLRR